MLHLTGTAYRWVEVDTRRAETRTEAFLARNPDGKVPVLELPDGTNLPESNAILYYLGRDSQFFPASLPEQAQVLRWMFFEQYSHEPFIATNRWWIAHAGTAQENAAKIKANHERGVRALQVMEGQLRKQAFIAGSQCSLADIALFAYTHVAPEGQYDLAPFPAVQAWLARVQSLPHFVPMDTK